MVSRAKTESIPIQCKKRRNVIFFGEKIFPVEYGGLQVFVDFRPGACKKKDEKKSRKSLEGKKKGVPLQSRSGNGGAREAERGSRMDMKRSLTRLGKQYSKYRKTRNSRASIPCRAWQGCPPDTQE